MPTENSHSNPEQTHFQLCARTFFSSSHPTPASRGVSKTRRHPEALRKVGNVIGRPYYREFHLLLLRRVSPHTESPHPGALCSFPSMRELLGGENKKKGSYSQTMCSVVLMSNVFKVGIQVRLTNNQHIMYYMGSPLTGHLFLLFRGSFPQRGERRLVPATQIHLCGRHEGQVLHLAAQLRLLFAREQTFRT